MTKALLGSVLALGIAACSIGEAKELPARPAAVNAAPSLPSGTRVTARLRDSITSRVNKTGDGRRAIVIDNVADDAGNIIIPVGSTVMLSIAELETGTDNTTAQGTLRLEVTAVTIDERTYPVAADLEAVPHYMQPRSRTGAEMVRVSAGPAGAVYTAVRDVVVPRGTPIAFTLTQAMTLRTK